MKISLDKSVLCQHQKFYTLGMNILCVDQKESHNSSDDVTSSFMNDNNIVCRTSFPNRWIFQDSNFLNEFLLYLR